MDSLFTSVLEISWQAGLIALAVMAVRPLLRRAPRRAVCMLWLLVALRLLLPARLTVESPVSLQQPESPPILAYQELRQQERSMFPPRRSSARKWQDPLRHKALRCWISCPPSG